MNSPSPSVTDNPPTPLAIVHSITHRLSVQSSTCKLASVVLASASLFLAVGHGGGSSLLWAAAPVGLLGLVDAACIVEARRMAKWGWDLSTKDRTDLGKSAELLRAQAEGPGYPAILTRLFGVFSLSVWPFYLGLAGVMAAVWHANPPAPVPPAPAKEIQSANPSLNPSLAQSKLLPNHANFGAPSFGGQGQRMPAVPPSFPPRGMHSQSFPPGTVNRFPQAAGTSLPHTGKPPVLTPPAPAGPGSAPAVTPAAPAAGPVATPATIPLTSTPLTPTAVNPAKAP